MAVRGLVERGGWYLSSSLSVRWILTYRMPGRALSLVRDGTSFLICFQPIKYLLHHYLADQLSHRKSTKQALYHRSLRCSVSGRYHSVFCQQRVGVEVDVVVDEARDEEVRVVVPIC